jgi:hypothetical protein
MASPVPTVTPSSKGLPGAALLLQILGWVFWVVLLVCIGAIAYHAGRWAIGSRSDNPAYVTDGKRGVLRALVATLVIGLAQALVQGLYSVASSVH